jgi:8-oxo-dGTP diphosphatase
MSPSQHLTSAGMSIVVAAAMVRDGRLLAAQRATPETLAGCWELPGGKVEPGENPVAALHRELMEELGTQVVVGVPLVGPLAGDWPLGEHSVLRVFLVDGCDPEPTAGESHLQIRWVTRADAESLNWLPADRAPVLAVFASAQ